ncbi:GNAT family N-acetyltransferase [Natronomonas amylolytica]|uniref:GNAT family N-acetyltransferase n=1 Tax=Natronomonas amylolytica TaxID=3108498 RepID=UPI00300A7089
MELREATDADIDAIRRVAERSWEVDYPAILTRETAQEAVSEWYGSDGLADAIAEGRTELLVAERDGEVVGFAHATWNGSEAEGYILRLYVHPDHRGRGVGGELLEGTRQALAGYDVDRIHAMVLAENDPGNAFYERFGFERADESRTRIGEGTYQENRYVLEL